MFIDEAVTVREDLPGELLDAFAELKDYYDNYLAGKISREDLDSIFRKYGIA